MTPCSPRATSSPRATLTLGQRQRGVSVLESLPGVGKVRARHIMSELEISESRRLRGLGTNQRRALLEKFAG